MKVFLDVGAHDGATLSSVRNPKYAFDRIFCFEPASPCWPALEAVQDRRVTVCRFGLWHRNCEQPLYDPGSVGASLFEDKFKTTPAAEVARFVRATDWFRENLGEMDTIYVKLNCEGAEADIIEDLIQSGQFARLRSVMIDPDIRKIPSQAYRFSELTERLRASGLTNYAMQDEVMVGNTHRERIEHWLRTSGAEEPSLAANVRQVAYLLSEAAHGRRGPLRAALQAPRKHS